MTRRYSLTAALALALVGRLRCAGASAELRRRSAEAGAEARSRDGDDQQPDQTIQGQAVDPSVFCAKSSGLIAAENAMIAYMEKNKDWCGIPDETLADLKTNHVKSAAFSGKAYKVAAEMKKAKEQAANGGRPIAQPLPAGRFERRSIAIRVRCPMRDRIVSSSG